MLHSLNDDGDDIESFGKNRSLARTAAAIGYNAHVILIKSREGFSGEALESFEPMAKLSPRVRAAIVSLVAGQIQDLLRDAEHELAKRESHAGTKQDPSTSADPIGSLKPLTMLIEQLPRLLDGIYEKLADVSSEAAPPQIPGETDLTWNVANAYAKKNLRDFDHLTVLQPEQFWTDDEGSAGTAKGPRSEDTRSSRPRRQASGTSNPRPAPAPDSKPSHEARQRLAHLIGDDWTGPTGTVIAGCEAKLQALEDEVGKREETPCSASSLYRRMDSIAHQLIARAGELRTRMAAILSVLADLDDADDPDRTIAREQFDALGI
jgi:hypothetical protein